MDEKLFKIAEEAAMKEICTLFGGVSLNEVELLKRLTVFAYRVAEEVKRHLFHKSTGQDSENKL